MILGERYPVQTGDLVARGARWAEVADVELDDQLQIRLEWDCMLKPPVEIHWTMVELVNGYIGI